LVAGASPQHALPTKTGKESLISGVTKSHSLCTRQVSENDTNNQPNFNLLFNAYDITDVLKPKP